MVILFDLDDTLLDHSTAFRAATEILHKSVDSSLSLEQFSSAWTASLERHFERYLAGELSYEAQRRARVRETIDPTLSDEAVDEVFATYLTSYEANWSLFADVQPCFNRLSRYRLGVVSNGQAHQQHMKLERTGIAGKFDCVVISEECGYAKPNPEIFLRACSLLHEEPTSALHVGDLYDVDATGARRAGLTGVWLDRAGKATPEHLPPLIRSLDDLAQFIDSMES